MSTNNLTSVRYQHTRIQNIVGIQNFLEAFEKRYTGLADLIGHPLSAHTTDAVMVGDSATAFYGGFHDPSPAIEINRAHLIRIGRHCGKSKIEIQA